MEPTRRRTSLIATPLLLAAALSFTACAGGGSSDAPSSSGGAAVEKSAPDAGEVPAADADAMVDSFAYDGSSAASLRSTARGQAPEAEDAADTSGVERSVISTGVVSLLGDDVEAARFDVQKIVDGRGGEVAEEKTQTDEDGQVSRSRLVVRIPVDEFDDAMEELEGVARLESSSRNSEDVTTEVIDTDVRIRAQTESLKRVEVLLARARTIRDIVSIEAQLTRRQADLDSLKSRQAYLEDQTSMATITVFLAEIPPKAVKTEKKEEATGFLAGLSSGWHGLKTFLIGGATVLGALLPFAVLLALLGVPALLIFRRLRAGRTARTPSAA